MNTNNNQEQTTYNVSRDKLISLMRGLADDNSGLQRDVLIYAADQLDTLQKENEELKRNYVKNDYFLFHP